MVIAIISLSILILWREIYFSRIEKNLLDRIMSRDYGQYIATQKKANKTEPKVEYETATF